MTTQSFAASVALNPAVCVHHRRTNYVFAAVLLAFERRERRSRGACVVIALGPSPLFPRAIHLSFCLSSRFLCPFFLGEPTSVTLCLRRRRPSIDRLFSPPVSVPRLGFLQMRTRKFRQLNFPVVNRKPSRFGAPFVGTEWHWPR